MISDHDPLYSEGCRMPPDVVAIWRHNVRKIAEEIKNGYGRNTNTNNGEEVQDAGKRK